MNTSNEQYLLIRADIWKAARPERYVLSETARHRRKVVERIELAIAAFLGAGVYLLTGLALRWLGVA